ncbi:hypothetical protein HOY82DRAFT_575989 [Tuber indicum]|nr:hypothetical protein HOY82DRAFT_575989 [Tuber indicum]
MVEPPDWQPEDIKIQASSYTGGNHLSESPQGQSPAPPKPVYMAAHLCHANTFIYFSRNLVSIPPGPWINSLHRKGIRVLVTPIADYRVGSSCPVEIFRAGKLRAVAELVPGGQVIWYDPLTLLNQVEAARTMAYFMHWVPNIYPGIDFSGRGSLGGRGTGVGEALSAIPMAGNSAALFAPRWTYEYFDGKAFQTVDQRFWVGDGDDVEVSPVKLVSYFVSEKVCGGFGKRWWIDGVVCSIPRFHSPTLCRAYINRLL